MVFFDILYFFCYLDLKKVLVTLVINVRLRMALRNALIGKHYMDVLVSTLHNFERKDF